MKRNVLVVIAVVVVFLALIVAYSMTPPDGSDAKGGSPTAAKH
jgi:hypothetical protein